MTTSLIDVSLYSAIYQVTRRAAEAGSVPLATWRPGTTLTRTVDDQHLTSGQARQVPPKSSTKSYRFSGARPYGATQGGTPGPRDGGLYLSASYRANLAENVYYGIEKRCSSSLKPEDQELLVALDMGMIPPSWALDRKVQYIYELKSGIEVIDITRPESATFLRSLETHKDLKPLLGNSQGSLLNALLAPGDYSASRAFSNAVRDAGSGIAGLVAPTAREVKHLELSGNNAALFGPDLHVFAELRPVGQRVIVPDFENGTSRVIYRKLSETSGPLSATGSA